MNNLVALFKKHQAIVYSVVGAVFTVLVQQGVINTNNKLVAVVIAILAGLGISVVSYRQTGK